MVTIRSMMKNERIINDFIFLRVLQVPQAQQRVRHQPVDRWILGGK